MSAKKPLKKLKSCHRKACIMIAAGGKDDKTISLELGKSANWVWYLRQEPLAQAMIEEKRREFEERMMNDPVNLPALFNRESVEAFKTLQQLNRERENGGIALKAAQEILERAPVAPKRRSGEDQGPKSINIYLTPEQGMNILTACREVGAQEVIDLMPGQVREITDGRKPEEAE